MEDRAARAIVRIVVPECHVDLFQQSAVELMYSGNTMLLQILL
jgi:hypothetical protein